MDITQWLQHTVDRAPPEPSSEHYIPDFIRPQVVESHKPHAQHSRSKRRASPVSSELLPTLRLARDGRIALHPSSVPDQSRVASRVDVQARRRRTAPSTEICSPRPARTTTKQYERRPRHKTRPDHYEYKASKRRQRESTREHAEPQRKRRKPQHLGHHNGADGLVSSFALNTQRKNSRLTVSPPHLCTENSCRCGCGRAHSLVASFDLKSLPACSSTAVLQRRWQASAMGVGVMHQSLVAHR
jgi:hypothetical protein